MKRGQPSTVVTVGVVSDTHGLVRPEALEALRGVDRIVHAGDVGGAEVLNALEAIAPTTAVRGNNDVGPWAKALPESATLEVGGVRIHLIHDLATLDIDVAKERIAVVVSGHSHRPARDTKNGVLYFNPGSAGPRRFRLPIAVGRLRIAGTAGTRGGAASENVTAEIVELDLTDATGRRASDR